MKPVLNHVAFLVPNAIKASEYLKQFDYKIGPTGTWEGEGTLEIYVGDLASETAIVDYVNDVKNMSTWSAEVENEVIGFISIKKHNIFSAEIFVMAILENYHRKNFGKMLIETAENYLIPEGFKFLQVKTLSESREDENYAKTRKFYLKNGFVALEEFESLWEKGNPCQLMIKNLRKNNFNLDQSTAGIN